MMEAGLSEVLGFLLLPFVTCLILSGIHCYLGFHVLTRGVIFVDLSLAQIAAFGSTLALLLGFHADDSVTYLISLMSALVASGLFARARRLEAIMPQEAVIGTTYALGAASVILCANSMSHGMEHVKTLMVGQVLWVGLEDVVKVALIYTAVGVVHFIFRKQFFAASRGELQQDQGFWDFCFYGLFAVVITSSVKVAGVLQVFSYLIVPSLVANFLKRSFRFKLIFGWCLSFVLSLVGMTWSYLADLPAGAAIVVCFTVVPMILVLLMRPQDRA